MLTTQQTSCVGWDGERLTSCVKREDFKGRYSKT